MSEFSSIHNSNLAEAPDVPLTSVSAPKQPITTATSSQYVVLNHPAENNGLEIGKPPSKDPVASIGSSMTSLSISAPQDPATEQAVKALAEIRAHPEVNRSVRRSGPIEGEKLQTELLPLILKGHQGQKFFSGHEELTSVGKFCMHDFLATQAVENKMHLAFTTANEDPQFENTVKDCVKEMRKFAEQYIGLLKELQGYKSSAKSREARELLSRGALKILSMYATTVEILPNSPARQFSELMDDFTLEKANRFPQVAPQIWQRLIGLYAYVAARNALPKEWHTAYTGMEAEVRSSCITFAKLLGIWATVYQDQDLKRVRHISTEGEKFSSHVKDTVEQETQRKIEKSSSFEGDNAARFVNELKATVNYIIRQLNGLVCITDPSIQRGFEQVNSDSAKSFAENLACASRSYESLLGQYALLRERAGEETGSDPVIAELLDRKLLVDICVVSTQWFIDTLPSAPPREDEWIAHHLKSVSLKEQQKQTPSGSLNTEQPAAVSSSAATPVMSDKEINALHTKLQDARESFNEGKNLHKQIAETLGDDRAALSLLTQTKEAMQRAADGVREVFETLEEKFATAPEQRPSVFPSREKLDDDWRRYDKRAEAARKWEQDPRQKKKILRPNESAFNDLTGNQPYLSNLAPPSRDCIVRTTRYDSDKKELVVDNFIEIEVRHKPAYDFEVKPWKVHIHLSPKVDVDLSPKELFKSLKAEDIEKAHVKPWSMADYGKYSARWEERLQEEGLQGLVPYYWHVTPEKALGWLQSLAR